MKFFLNYSDCTNIFENHLLFVSKLPDLIKIQIGNVINSNGIDYVTWAFLFFNIF